MASFLGTVHHGYEYTVQEGLDAIREVSAFHTYVIAVAVACCLLLCFLFLLVLLLAVSVIVYNGHRVVVGTKNCLLFIRLDPTICVPSKHVYYSDVRVDHSKMASIRLAVGRRFAWCVVNRCHDWSNKVYILIGQPILRLFVDQ